MIHSNMAIATMTLARTDEEEKILKRSMLLLSSIGLPVYVTDGGSGQHFLSFLQSLPNTTLSERKGLWPQVKQSLQQAADNNADFVFYTEPDKYLFFEQALPSFLQQIQVHNQTGIVLISRSAKGFATFPPFQQMTETTINNCCEEVIKLRADYTYGPFLINSKIIPYLNALDNNIGWGWRPYAFCTANSLGLKVESFMEDAFCPPDQRLDNATERIYRMQQLTQNIQGITLAAKANLPTNKVGSH